MADVTLDLKRDDQGLAPYANLSDVVAAADLAGNDAILDFGLIYDLLFSNNYPPLVQKRNADGVWLPAPHPLFCSVFNNTPKIASTAWDGPITLSLSGLQDIVNTENRGVGINYRTGGAAGQTCGMFCLWLYRGSAAGFNGFLIGGEVDYPDASYDETGAGTGCRIIMGTMSGGTLNSDNQAGDRTAFVRYHTYGGIKDSNWMFETKDNVTAHRTDTGVPFVATHRYRYMIFCPGNGAAAYWWIKDLTNGTEASGTETNNLCRGGTMQYQLHYMYSVNAVVRNFTAFKFFASRPPCL